ncbi:Type II secretory pathway component PulD-like protein [Acidovorax sp.]|uniref:Type II secretory pathway component PulD-like protein n=1 Tax=Acidovorax sp. TaxID=1872122 RepID=UPI0025BEA0CC|nr:Type II secretory pathway component PulD-like protein [Acidovorax sp.]
MFKKVMPVLGLVALLSGCALTTTQERIDTTKKTAIDLRDLNLAQATTATVSRTSKPRLAGEEIVLRSQNALPAVFGRQVTYATHGAQSLSEVFESVSQMAGIPIRASEISATNAQGGASTMQFPGVGNQTGGLSGRVQVEFSGSLRGLLDELASRTEASWRFQARTNTIEFFKYETRTLSIYLPPGSKTIDASISLSGVSGGGGGASGGGASGGGASGGGASAGNVSVTQSMTVNPWSSIMDVVSAILSEGASQSAMPGSGASGSGAAGAGGGRLTASGNAGRAAANPELGILTITARPRAVERVAAYVESINARFAQNVLIDIKIYSLTMDNKASLGFSLDTVYKYLNANGVSIVGAPPLQAGTGVPGQATFTIDNPRSRLFGSSMVAQALSQFGNVALQTQGQVLAVNGQPAPIQVANEVNYLASSSLTQAPNVGSTATLTPGTRVVGFTANFVPLLLGDNRILLQYQMQLSSLTALTQVTSGNSSIQTPQISSQSLQQQAFVKDGQSIVLFGFDQNRDSMDTALGIGNASRAARAERQMVVIVMTVNGGRKDV